MLMLGLNYGDTRRIFSLALCLDNFILILELVTAAHA